MPDSKLEFHIPVRCLSRLTHPVQNMRRSIITRRSAPTARIGSPGTIASWYAPSAAIT
jgi:hypothetical protein